jgi:hypothetical protein
MREVGGMRMNEYEIKHRYPGLKRRKWQGAKSTHLRQNKTKPQN